MAKKSEKCCSSKWCPCEGEKGYCHCHMFVRKIARALFILGVIFALNTMPFMANVSWWTELLLGLGFVFMAGKH